jgi:ubiquinol-cytochrome c reductase iron-sulfur subunit
MGDDLSHKITLLALAAAAVAAAGAAIAAGSHASPAAIGWLGAMAFFALAVATTATARGLRAADDLREPREPHGPSHPEPLPSDVTRRGVFGQIWGVGLGAFTLLAAIPLFALHRHTSAPRTAWKAGSRLVNPDGKPMRADDLAIGGIETVFPEGAVNAPEAATLLIRLPAHTADVDPARHDWIQRGNIAYSKICTHAGCPVAIYRERSLELYCPCHQSVFDVLHSGKPTSGRDARAAAVRPRRRRARLSDRTRRLRGPRGTR